MGERDDYLVSIPERVDALYIDPEALKMANTMQLDTIVAILGLLDSIFRRLMDADANAGGNKNA